jgi:hypothetical protein
MEHGEKEFFLIPPVDLKDHDMFFIITVDHRVKLVIRITRDPGGVDIQRLLQYLTLAVQFDNRTIHHVSLLVLVYHPIEIRVNYKVDIEHLIR